MLRRCLFAFLCLAPLASIRAQDDQPAMPLYGHVEGNTYYNPSGLYSIRIPIDMELNGNISDTPQVVIFQDAFRQVSIAVIPQDAIQKWELQTQDMKSYLQEFFEQKVFPSYYRDHPKASYETNARFIPDRLGGCLIAYVLLPGGSMFDSPDLHIAAESTPPVAKRGNLLFVHDGNVVIVSTELAERVTEGSYYHLTVEQEDLLLRDRLLDIASRFRFLKFTNPAAPQF